MGIAVLRCASLVSLVAVAMALGDCRSPGVAPNVHGVASLDAQAGPVALDSAARDEQADPYAVIEYRGEEIRLTKRYDDFDVYKNDPNNIAPQEYARVRKLVETAPVPEHCASFQEITRAEFELEFPGYGSGGVDEWRSTDPRRVEGVSIEIPHANANRFLIYLRDDGGYRLVDDAVLPEPPFITQVSVSDGQVIYRTREGTVVVVRPIRGQAAR